MNIVQHIGRGRDAAVTLGQIAESAGISRREVEAAVNEARREGVPVCSGSEGVWLASTSQEALQHAEALRSRAIHQLETAASLKAAGESWELREAKVEALTLWDAA